MADEVDRAIRDDLLDRAAEAAPDAVARSNVAYADAIRAVLDKTAEWDNTSYWVFGNEIRAVLARELGVDGG